MEINKALVFDIWSDYAHFRKIETTTSPLTYSIPTGTALSGLIAAIIGLERDSYYNLFSKEKARFGIRILNPLKKTRMNINLIKTDEGFFLRDIRKNHRSPTPYEMIKNPRYRIYVCLQDENIYKKLKDCLENHKSVFTPYLGISEFIANFEFVGEYNQLKAKKENQSIIHSVLKKKDFKINIDKLEEQMRWSREIIPVYMNDERVVEEYSEILFEQNGNPITVKDCQFYEIGEDNVIFI